MATEMVAEEETTEATAPDVVARNVVNFKMMTDTLVGLQIVT